MTRLGRFYEWVVEIGWLLAIAATPMYFNVYSSRVFEPDKATVLRSVVLLAAAAFLLGWIERRSSKERGSLPERSSPEPSGGAAGQWRQSRSRRCGSALISMSTPRPAARSITAGMSSA